MVFGSGWEAGFYGSKCRIGLNIWAGVREAAQPHGLGSTCLSIPSNKRAVNWLLEAWLQVAGVFAILTVASASCPFPSVSVMFCRTGSPLKAPLGVRWGGGLHTGQGAGTWVSSRHTCPSVGFDGLWPCKLWGATYLVHFLFVSCSGDYPLRRRLPG